MRKRGLLGRIVVWSLLVAVGLGASEVNIAPDAVTRATEGYNEYEGDTAVLTDGLYPGNSDESGKFSVSSKLNLTFQFDEPHMIAGLRLYVGEYAGAYQAFAYLGARFGSNGQTEMGEGAELVADAIDIDFATNTWVDLTFAAAMEADYIELSTESGAEIYEIEIFAPGGESTAVEARSWGEVKSLQR
jgi:hypothetical protein